MASSLATTAAFAAETAAGKHGVVVAGHPTAADAGLEVLKNGGNAIDAAVATAMTLGVAEPWGSGLGGKLVLLYFDAESGQVFALQGMDQASRSIDVDAFVSLKETDREVGPQSVAVPGMLAGWGEAHRRWGGKPWAELIQPAIDAATDGVAVDRYDVSAANHASAKLKAGGGLDVFLPGDEPLATGDVVRYPDLAATMKMIRDDGPGVMYGGDLGRRIAEHVRSQGGAMDAEDFASYQPFVAESPHVDYRGHQVFSGAAPANGGATVLLSLACMERMDSQNHATPTIAKLDQRLRVLHEVYPVVRRNIGQGHEGLGVLQEQLAPQNVQRLASAAAALDFAPITPTAQSHSQEQTLSEMDNAERLGCTSHFVIADAQGNVVSATQSLGFHFGSGVTVPGTGIVLNNSMDNFAVKYEPSPNYIAPGKLARSSMSPAIILKDGQAVLALGAPGGQRIPTAVLQVIRDIYSNGLDPTDAVDAPRIHLRHTTAKGVKRRHVHLEADVDGSLAPALAQHGWQPTVMDTTLMYFGGVNLITQDDNGEWLGVADNRRSNAARGW